MFSNTMMSQRHTYSRSGNRNEGSVGSIMNHAFIYGDARVRSPRTAKNHYLGERFHRRIWLGAAYVALALSPIGSYAALSPDPNPVGNTITIGLGETVYTRAESGSINYGIIAVEAGGTLRNNNMLLNIGGTVQLQPYTGTVVGASFQNYGIFSNHSSGLLDVQGSVVNANAGSFLNGVSNDATLPGVITVTGGGSIGNYGGGFTNFSGSSIFTDSSAYLYNGATWDNAGSFTLNGYFENAAEGTFNMISPTGGSTTPAELVVDYLFNNNGQMNVAGGAQVTINAAAALAGNGTFTQNDAATKTVVDGTMTQGTIEILAGELCGTGSVTSASMVIGPTAIVCPGLSPGTLRIVADVTLGGIYRAEIESAALHDVLDINGALELGPDSVLELHFGAGTKIGDTLSILQATSISGSFQQILFPAGYNGFVDILDNGLSVTVTEISAVPVPPAVWLFGSGLLGLAGIARRKAGRRAQ